MVDHLGGTTFWSVFGLKTGTPKCGLLLTLPASYIYICTIKIRGDYGVWPSTGRECRKLQGLALSRPKLETVAGFGPRLVHLDQSGHQSGQIWLQLQGLAPDLSDLRAFKNIYILFKKLSSRTSRGPNLVTVAKSGPTGGSTCLGGQVGGQTL